MIKKKCIFRLTKEKLSYEKESEQQEAKIEKMKTEGKDEYDIKKQVFTFSVYSEHIKMYY